MGQQVNKNSKLNVNTVGVAKASLNRAKSYFY